MKTPGPGDLVTIWTDPLAQVHGRLFPEYVRSQHEHDRVRSKYVMPQQSCGLCLAVKYVITTGAQAYFYLFLTDGQLLWLCDLEAEFDVID